MTTIQTGWRARAGLIAGLLLTQGMALAQPAGAQPVRTTTTTTTTTTTEFVASNIVVPQQACFVVRPNFERVIIQGVEANIDIVEQVATTTLKVTLSNPASRQLEAEMLVPVPDKSTVRSFSFDGPGGKEPTVRLLPRDEARGIYESIVRASRDPALLEFANSNLVRSSVFPVPANGTTTVTLVYEAVMPADGSRVDFVLPRTQSLELSGTQWKVHAKIRTKRPMSTIYSPSHEIATTRLSPTQAEVTLTDAAMRQPGSFRLSYLLEGEGVTASLMAYPDPEIGGGYYLMLAGVPADVAVNRDQAQKREVMVVIDRSGSMRGEKIEQAKAAAISVLDGLAMGEAFNVVDYSDTIAMFAEHPVIKDEESLADARQYIAALQANGGTNIHDALLSTVRQKPTQGMLSMVLFLTDGLPTVGNTGEVAIRNDTAQANTHKRRIFTFGVGYDVNAPLLDRLAESARGSSINVLPKESVEQAVSAVFRKLAGPVVSEPRLVALGADGKPTTRAVREQMPGALPDLFEGDQLVVLGQYTDADRLHLRLEGDFRGAPKAYEFDFKLDSATTRNDFVPRLWATRKIAMLVDEIRQRGAEAPSAAAPGDPNHADPRTKELVDEIVRLSTKFGILTEYTAFLATEPDGKTREAQLSFDAAGTAAAGNLQERAVEVRSGLAAVNQSVNVKAQQVAACTNLGNEYWNANMERVSVSTVQQIYDQALFLRNGCWVDSRITARDMASATPKTVDDKPRSDRTVTFGSDDYFKLARRLADEGRPGIIALRGEVLVLVDGERVLVTAPTEPEATPETK